MEARRLRLPALRQVAIGGADIPARLLERAIAVGLPVIVTYGLGACGSVISVNTTSAGPTDKVATLAANGEVSVGDRGKQGAQFPAAGKPRAARFRPRPAPDSTARLRGWRACCS